MGRKSKGHKHHNNKSVGDIVAEPHTNIGPEHEKVGEIDHTIADLTGHLVTNPRRTSHAQLHSQLANVFENTALTRESISHRSSRTSLGVRHSHSHVHHDHHTSKGDHRHSHSHHNHEKRNTKLLLDDEENGCGDCVDKFLKIFICQANSLKVVSQTERFRIRVGNKYEAIINLLVWKELPKNLHDLAKGKNYLSNKLWMLCFADNQVKSSYEQRILFPKKEDPLGDLLDELLVVAEDVGTVTNQMESLLIKIKNKFEAVENNGNLSRTKSIIPEIDLKCSLISGNSVNDFSTLHCEVKEPRSHQWVRFSERADKSEILKEGLREVIEDVKVIRTHIIFINFIIAEATARTLCNFFKSDSLYPALKWCKKYYRKRNLNRALDLEDDKTVLDTLMEHVNFIINQGELIVKEMAEFVLLNRLCLLSFKHDVDAIPMRAGKDGKVKEYGDVLQKWFHRPFKYLVRWYDLELGDFLSVPFPDTLRKAPVLVTTRQMQMGIFGMDSDDKKRDSKSKSSSARQSQLLLSVDKKDLGIINKSWKFNDLVSKAQKTNTEVVLTSEPHPQAISSNSNETLVRFAEKVNQKGK